MGQDITKFAMSALRFYSATTNYARTDETLKGPGTAGGREPGGTAAAGWEKQVRHLEASIDGDFGKHFRLVRNRTAHALHRRARPSVDDLTLGNFFVRYHYAVLCLFETAKFTWTVRDIESFDWMEMEAFDVLAASETMTVSENV
jgi:hypothetical protein